MIKIGITGSLASGKTTASKIISNKKAHFLVLIKKLKKLYKKSFKKKIIKNFQFKKKIQ